MRAVGEVALGLVLGSLLGLVLPVAREVDEVPDRVSSRPVVSGSRPPCPEPEQSTTSPAQTLEAWLGEWQQFVETWGTPTIMPAGWDPDVEERHIRERLGELPLDLLEVECDFHPCVAVVGQLGEIDLDSLRAAARVGPKDIHIGEAWSDSTSAEVGTVIFVDEDLEELERKWALRLAARLQSQTEPKVVELLEPPAE